MVTAKRGRLDAIGQHLAIKAIEAKVGSARFFFDDTDNMALVGLLQISEQDISRDKRGSGAETLSGVDQVVRRQLEHMMLLIAVTACSFNADTVM